VHLLDLDRTGIHRLGPWLAGQRITIYRSVVSVFRQFAGGLAGDERFPHLRIVSIGGEPIMRTDLELFQRHCDSSAVFVGMLAATEAGVFCQYLADRNTRLADGVLPAGYPVADMEIRVLHGDGRPAAPGEAGEIVVRSRYVAEGYWRRPELTAATFRPDPEDPGGRLYHTGDLGLRRPDGALVHLGRQDLQVKVRGHRVEPAEVEAAVLEVGGVRQAAVALWEARPGVSHLVAYVVPEAGPGPTVRQLREALAHRLPEVMLPTVVVTVEALPRTATGKVDRRRLPAPAPGRPLAAATLAPPRTPLEAQLAAIWREALGLDAVGIHDHLLDLGGHSVLAAQIAARVGAALGRPLLPSALLEHPTVAELAAALLADHARGTGSGR
jgi:acyl-coenzyme A synthetase/AMP-(fatty) acid ligase